MAANEGESASNLFAQVLQARMNETRLTISRPLSPEEVKYYSTRLGGGMSDPSTIVPLTCAPGHAITDDQIILACAVLRLRHPLFASHITVIDTPHFFVNTPATRAHALRAAEAQIEFHTFADQDDAVLRLRDEWLACDLDKALDIRERTCAVWWGRDADPHSGKYVLGVLTTHFVADQRRIINLVRQLVELLASPARAQSELDAHTFGTSPEPLPASTEHLIPTLSEDEEEASKAKSAFDKLYTCFTNKPMSGIVPDGPLSAFDPRILRKVWTREETSRILQACKAHGVTITHLVNIAGALSAFNSDKPRAANGSGDDYTVYFDVSQPIDLAPKIRESSNGQTTGEMETAVRTMLYPIALSILRSAVTNATQNPSNHMWPIASHFKEQNDAFVKSPHFWRFLVMYDSLVNEIFKAKVFGGQPGLPIVSSLGDLKFLLPAQYTVQEAGLGGSHTNGHSVVADSEGAGIRITDMWVAGRLDIFSLVSHLFTFDGRLHLQFRYNANRTSPAMMEPWFERVVDSVTQAAQA